MSRIRSRLIGWTSGVVVALALGVPGIAAAQIANTKHNLSTGQTTGNRTTGAAATDQICVFCHTPHGASTNTAVAAPLWNKAVSASGTYKTYNSTGNATGGASATATSTIDGEILAVGSVSLACLSCHDGTQAMDNMINAPGSGSTAITPAWAGANVDNSTGKLTGAFSNLGGDLNNDHPIGIQYCGGGLSGGATTAIIQAAGNCNDADFVQGANVKNAAINGQQVFWVERDGTPTKRGKADIILYTRTFAAGAGPSVECGSCHDPHVEQKSSDQVHFMRVTTAGSQICLACHVK